MKRALIIMGLMAVGTCVLAQVRTGYLTLQGGVQAGDSGHVSGFPFAARVGSGFTASIEGTFLVSSHFGIHGALWSSQGKLTINHEYYGARLIGKLDHSFSVLEIGPEWDFLVGKRGQVYIQASGGKTLGGTSSEWVPLTYRGQTWYAFKMARRQAWTAGATLGFRRRLGPRSGFVIQASVHRIDQWKLTTEEFRIGWFLKF